MDSRVNLRDRLTKLVRNDQVVALKAGTEIEDMSIAEIQFFREISQSESGEEIVPLILKIGGPEARQDMRSALSIGVNTILAPMVESVYALENFVSTAQEIGDEMQKSASLAINLETSLATSNLNDMILSRAFSSLSQVTIGRGDLSRSMHLGVDDAEVLNVTTVALKKIHNNGKMTSVGGGIKLQSIDMISRRLPTQRFNTRHVAIENNSEFRKNAAKSLYEVLAFEIDLYRAMQQEFPEREVFYRKRVEELERRLEIPFALKKATL